MRSPSQSLPASAPSYGSRTVGPTASGSTNWPFCSRAWLGAASGPCPGGACDETRFYAAIAAPGARALLIGRRAMLALGAPIGTWDCDFWLHPDDIERFNAAVAPFDLAPNRAPDEARRRGRYVLENGERVDVLVARSHSTVGGEPSFGW